MCKISIIVPVYNTEQYLPRSINSVLNQSFTDFEVLLIDDGSTDGSSNICDFYAEKDSRVRVLHKENGGVSSARNLGLDNAKGEWVCFVDSDDELFHDGLQIMVDGVCEEIDLVMAGYENYDFDGNLLYSIDIRDSRIISADEGAMEMYSPRDYRFQGYVWSKLYRLNVIKNRHLCFAEDLIFSEDRLFVTQYICSNISRIYYTTMPAYRYYERPESAMGTLNGMFNQGVITDLDARIRMRRFVNKRFDNEELAGVVDFDVYRGYRRIIGFMQTFHFEGRQQKRHLRRKTVEALGLFRYLSFERVRNKRRIEKKLRKLIGKNNN